MTLLRLASLALVLGVLGGCASMSETECQAADWRTIGYEDGVAGRAGDQIGQYRKACGKHGIAPDLAQYQSGRSEGLREFCKPANGFRVGARGYGYGGICPSDLDGEFTAAYESGHQLYTLRSRVTSATSELATLRDELDGIDGRIVKISAAIVDPETTNEERAQLVIDTKRLAERKGELKTRIPELERECAVYQRELDDYRATLNYIE